MSSGRALAEKTAFVVKGYKPAGRSKVFVSCEEKTSQPVTLPNTLQRAGVKVLQSTVGRSRNKEAILSCNVQRNESSLIGRKFIMQ